MRKFLLVLVGVFAGVGAFAAADNIPTSKNYVDNALALKQDKIAASDTTMVLTNTGTAGDYGTQGIYDATGEYAPQAQNLVDAITMNTGVQNAIDSEFQCVEWDDHGECLLMDVFGSTGHTSSKNLFNLKSLKIAKTSNVDITKTHNGINLTKIGGTPTAYIEFANTNDYLGKTLTVSAKKTCDQGHASNIMYGLRTCDDNYINCTSYSTSISIPYELDGIHTKIVLFLYMHSTASGETCTYYDIMVEEGSVATPYVPYGNLYIPTGN